MALQILPASPAPAGLLLGRPQRGGLGAAAGPCSSQIRRLRALRSDFLRKPVRSVTGGGRAFELRCANLGPRKVCL